MLGMPGLYDAFHYSSLRTGGRLARLAEAGARRQLVPELRAYLDEHPADLLISVFATGAAAASALADRYPAMRHIVFCTDVTPHRLWVHRHVDMYLVTAEIAELAVLRFQPDARVQVVPAARPASLLPAAQPGPRPGLDWRSDGSPLRPADVGRLGTRAGGRGGRGACRRRRARARSRRAQRKARQEARRCRRPAAAGARVRLH